MLQWDDLRLFAAAWDAGSLTGAAKMLGVAQATLSRRMAHLESTAGHVLFDRTRAGLVPTSAAHALWPHVESMLAAARGAEASMKGLEVAPEGVVRLAVPPGVAVDLVPSVVLALARRFPAVRLDVLSDARMRDIDRHEADIALRNFAPERGDLVWRRLLDFDVGIWGAPAYVRSLPAGVTAGELQWLQYSDELAHIPQAVFVREVLAGRPPAMWTNDYLAMLAAAKAGVGCLIVPDVQGRLAGLERVPIELPGSPSGPVYLVVHRALRNVPRVAAVVAVLDEVIEALDGVGVHGERIGHVALRRAP